MNLTYLLIADSATETKDGKLIINGVFDSIHSNVDASEKTPVVHGSMAVVFGVEDIEPEQECTFNICLKKDSGDGSIFDKDITAIASKSGKLSFVGGANLLKFNSYGTYVLTISYGDQKLGSTKLQVKKLP